MRGCKSRTLPTVIAKGMKIKGYRKHQIHQGIKCLKAPYHEYHQQPQPINWTDVNVEVETRWRHGQNNRKTNRQ